MLELGVEDVLLEESDFELELEESDFLSLVDEDDDEDESLVLVSLLDSLGLTALDLPRLSVL